MMHEWMRCHDEAANHQLPIAVTFWIIQIVSTEECSTLIQNRMQIHCSIHSGILNATATQYTCSLNGIYRPWLAQWSRHCSHMCIPVLSPLLPGYSDVTHTILIILKMVGLFLNRPHIYKCKCKCKCKYKYKTTYYSPLPFSSLGKSSIKTKLINVVPLANTQKSWLRLRGRLRMRSVHKLSAVDLADFKKIIYLFLFSYNCLHFLPIPPPQPCQSHLPLTSTLPLDFVLVSFIVAPVDPSPHYLLPTPLWLLLHCS